MATTVRAGSQFGHGFTVNTFNIDHMQEITVLVSKGFGKSQRKIRIINPFIDTQSNIKTVGMISEANENIPEGEGIFAPRNCHQQTVSMCKHLVASNRPFYLIW